MNKTKAFINTVVILAILFYVAGCAVLTFDQHNDYVTRSSKLRESFDILQSEHTGDQQMATLRNQFDNEDRLLQRDIDEKRPWTVSTNDRDLQKAACDTRLAAMETLLGHATALYPSATHSGPPVEASATSQPPPPPSDDAIAIEAAPSNNNTQIIQDMNQGQQGATTVFPHAG